jgi:phosphate transport system substrate-binding protein
VAVAAKDGDAPVAPEPANAYSGDYPLARFLLLSVNHKPGGQLDPLRREFIRYVLSASGQADVKKDGYLPVTAEVAREALGQFGIATP